MPVSELKFIKRFAEFRSKDEIKEVPPNTRGIYALLKHRSQKNRPQNLFDVVYVGMSGKAGIRGRLRSHSKSKTKADLWTHFSIFEVHDNVTENEVKELEGLFRQIYRKDNRANKLNRQREFTKFKKVRINNISIWKMKH
jgi:hypothetical protein